MKRCFVFIFVVFCIILLNSESSFAVEVYLKNGDRISGEVSYEDETTIFLETQVLGLTSVEKRYIKNIVRDQQQIVERPHSQKNEKVAQVLDEVEWQRKISIGYSEAGGNTESSEGSGEFLINRKSDHDEYTFKMQAYYSSSDDKNNGRKFYGQGRYAYSFGDTKKWYHFFKFEGDQDRFANIDYRLTPSTGLGYWFSDEEDFKLMAELAGGYQYTNYRDATDSETEGILVPRVYFEKELISGLKLVEDITVYPSVEDTGEYRLHSETSLIHPIDDQLSFKISLVDDFDSDPKGASEKNDYRVISSVDYSF